MISVFSGPQGVRSGWRVTLFLLLTIVIMMIGGAGLHLFATSGSDAMMLLQQLLMVTGAAAATGIFARAEERPFSHYGLGAHRTWRNLIGGLAAGFIVLSLLMAALTALGLYQVIRGPLHGADLLRWAVYWAALFVCVGFAEELLMRGYPLFTLTRSIGFWPSATIVAALFGLGHLGNSGQAIVGIFNACLAGLVFAYSVRWTGSLWWAIGCHITWDWAETFFFGVADSGIPARHSWLQGTPAGPDWLSGGSVGPEGSVLAAAALLTLVAAVRYTAPRYAAAELDQLVNPPVSGPSETRPPASEASTSPSTYFVDSGDTN